MQIGLEYALDADGLLVPFPGSTEQARFIVHRYSDRFMRFYSHDLPDNVRRQLARLRGEAAFIDREAIRDILASHTPCTSGFFGTSAVFVESPGPDECADVVHTPKGFMITVGGAVRSKAWSVRENESAAELAVETAVGYRRRGYARQVSAAWARHVLTRDKVALYSRADGNLASEALARSLGVIEFSSVAAYE